MSNTFDDVCDMYGEFLSEIVEKESASKDAIVEKVQKAAANKGKLPLVAHDGVKSFEQWLEVTGFHREVWQAEYVQALKDLFYSE